MQNQDDQDDPDDESEHDKGKKQQKQSAVWNYFTLLQNGSKAKCLQCKSGETFTVSLNST